MSSEDTERLYSISLLEIKKAISKFAKGGRRIHNRAGRRAKQVVDAAIEAGGTVVNPILNDASTVGKISKGIVKDSGSILSGLTGYIKDPRTIVPSVKRTIGNTRKWINNENPVESSIVGRFGKRYDLIDKITGKYRSVVPSVHSIRHALANTAENLGTKAANVAVSSEPLAYGYLIKPIAEKIGVKDIASSTGIIELGKKRYGQIKNLFRRGNNGTIVRVKRKLNEVSLNPGNTITSRVGEYIDSGGNKILDDYVTADKIHTHLSASLGNPISIFKAGTGYYDGDRRRTEIKTLFKGIGKGIDKVKSYFNSKSIKPITTEQTYDQLFHSLGKKYRKHLKLPATKFINTTGAVLQGSLTGQLPGYVYSGAPMMTGQTGKTVMRVIRRKGNSVMRKAHELIPIQRTAPVRRVEVAF